MEKKCPVHAFQKLISGKHKIRIIWNLKDGSKRYNEIMRNLEDTISSAEQSVAPRVLSRELKQLCEFGLIARTDFKTLPLKVEYSLTIAGKNFLPLISQMHEWGMQYL